ncbi:hypothetical protein JTE90_000961 [Oedothorax gibbosus]|uniref:Uncharacterized protein n=1 Tax=Oedothorax gibbosus TaxID=931172 RepID=A0AAV6TVF1_9ARAC|nr:hypothetical protein JTE90_000961 [Oedothorax gibbosus]
MEKESGEASGTMTRVKRFTVAIHPERRTDNEEDGHVVGSDILFANRLAPPLRDVGKQVQEAIQLHTTDGSLKDLEKTEEESQDTKSIKYWTDKLTYAFRSLTVSTKQRKNSFGSLFSSLGMSNFSLDPVQHMFCVRLTLLWEFRLKNAHCTLD